MEKNPNGRRYLEPDWNYVSQGKVAADAHARMHTAKKNNPQGFLSVWLPMFTITSNTLMLYELYVSKVI